MSKKDKNEEMEDIAREEKIAEIDIIKQSLEEIKKEALENYDRFLRVSAEFSNYKNRVDREKKELIRHTLPNFILIDE